MTLTVPADATDTILETSSTRDTAPDEDAETIFPTEFATLTAVDAVALTTMFHPLYWIVETVADDATEMVAATDFRIDAVAAAAADMYLETPFATVTAPEDAEETMTS